MASGNSKFSALSGTSMERADLTKARFCRITCRPGGIEIFSCSSSRLGGSRRASRANPQIRRAPESRAIMADLINPWKSKARSKAEARSRRNCRRGARSVSPDISPRLRAFVSISMRRSRSGLSLKISEVLCSTTHEISASGRALRITASEGKVCTMSPILPSFTMRILIAAMCTLRDRLSCADPTTRGILTLREEPCSHRFSGFLSRYSGNSRPNHRDGAIKDVFRGNRGHATVVDRTISQHAWRAVRRPADDFGGGGERVGGQRIRRTKNDQRPGSEGCAEMCWAGVVGYQQVTDADYRHSLGDCCLTGQ